MMYALNLDADGRISSATFPPYAPDRAVVAEALPEGNISDYLYRDDAFLYEPLPRPEPAAPGPTVELSLIHIWEIAALGKGAYKTASQYGVRANEYLQNIGTFSKAGYKEAAQGLGELAPMKTRLYHPGYQMVK